ncbi:MAG: NAD-dependent epimerase/dehydratase family protein [Acidobacteriota bacterium]
MKPLPDKDLEHILNYTRPLWDNLRSRRLFLTGGTGFFGAWLVESLSYCNRRLNLQMEAAILSRDPESFLRRMPHLSGDPALRLVRGDIRDFTFPEGGFDFVLHAAAPTSTDAASRPTELLSILLDGTRHVLAFARAAGVGKFLFVSSGAVYGPQPPTLSHIPEDYLGGPDWLNPAAAYAEGKRIAEQICALHAVDSEMRVRIARCFAFVGPHLPLDQHFAIGNFIRDALSGRDIQIRGDGTPMRSYLYAADLMIWLWTILLREAEPEIRTQVFNVGSGDAISIRALAREVVGALGVGVKIEIARQPSPGAPLLQYVPDVRKAEATLGLKPLIGLRDAIRRTAAWHLGWQPDPSLVN